MAEPDGLRIAAVLSADADLQVGPGGAAFLDGHGHELADAGLIDAGEGVLGQDLPVLVFHQETLLGVIARDAVGRLCQIVGAEREELGILGNLTGGQRGTRDLDHRAELVADLGALLLDHLLRDLFESRLLHLQLVDVAGERDHDLRMDVHPVLGTLDSRLDDGPHLHLGQFGDVDPQANAAQAEHRVGLAHGLDCCQHLLGFRQPLRVLAGDLQLGDFHEQLVVGR